ncbi:MAG: sigma-54 dependent transcriptional regulator [Bacteroidota bacterium]
MDELNIFIVEDDPWYSELLEYHLALNPDNLVQRFNSGKDFLAALHKKPDVVTLDYALPDADGATLLEKIKASSPETYVIVVSGQEDIATAVDLLKKGAYDYIVKNEDAKDRIWNTLRHVREHRALKEEVVQLRQEVGRKFEFENAIVGESKAMQKVFTLMKKACANDITVSVSGPTGTGKEVVAKAIHFNSGRAKKPFVPINVAAIPEELIESELFGHEKGAFTGAAARRIGKLEQAQGGTLFLDEIGEMSLNMQVKLLRALQERQLTRLGGTKTVSLDFRLIVATHRDLANEVEEGNFREDLYYRLLGLPINLPPLRDRGGDVMLLVRHFLDAFAKESGAPPLKISAEARQKLSAHNYPGNVRELKAIVELAAVMSDGGQLEPEDIRFSGIAKKAAFLNEELTLKEHTDKIIRHYLDKYDQDVYKVASLLDIGKSTIYRMLKAERETE